MPNPDCMICLTPIRRINWRPEKHCDCKVTVHKQCWDKWQETSKICIICRKEEESEYHMFRVQLITVQNNTITLRETQRIVGCFLFIVMGMIVIIFYSALSLIHPYVSIKDEL